MNSYTIRSGDTLSGIAARYHTTVGALARLNHLKNPSLIYTGHRLQIPGSHDTFEPHRTHPPPPPAHAHGVHGNARLAHAARDVAHQMNSQGWCATGVSRAIARALRV